MRVPENEDAFRVATHDLIQSMNANASRRFAFHGAATWGHQVEFCATAALLHTAYDKKYTRYVAGAMGKVLSYDVVPTLAQVAYRAAVDTVLAPVKLIAPRLAYRGFSWACGLMTQLRSNVSTAMEAVHPLQRDPLLGSHAHKSPPKLDDLVFLERVPDVPLTTTGVDPAFYLDWPESAPPGWSVELKPSCAIVTSSPSNTSPNVLLRTSPTAPPSSEPDDSDSDCSVTLTASAACKARASAAILALGYETGTCDELDDEPAIKPDVDEQKRDESMDCRIDIADDSDAEEEPPAPFDAIPHLPIGYSIARNVDVANYVDAKAPRSAMGPYGVFRAVKTGGYVFVTDSTVLRAFLPQITLPKFPDEHVARASSGHPFPYVNIGGKRVIIDCCSRLADVTPTGTRAEDWGYQDSKKNTVPFPANCYRAPLMNLGTYPNFYRLGLNGGNKKCMQRKPAAVKHHHPRNLAYRSNAPELPKMVSKVAASGLAGVEINRGCATPPPGDQPLPPRPAGAPGSRLDLAPVLSAAACALTDLVVSDPHEVGVTNDLTITGHCRAGPRTQLALRSRECTVAISYPRQQQCFSPRCVSTAEPAQYLAHCITPFMGTNVLAVDGCVPEVKVLSRGKAHKMQRAEWTGDPLKLVPPPGASVRRCGEAVEKPSWLYANGPVFASMLPHAFANSPNNELKALVDRHLGKPAELASPHIIDEWVACFLREWPSVLSQFPDDEHWDTLRELVDAQPTTKRAALYYELVSGNLDSSLAANHERDAFEKIELVPCDPDGVASKTPRMIQATKTPTCQLFFAWESQHMARLMKRAVVGWAAGTNPLPKFINASGLDGRQIGAVHHHLIERGYVPVESDYARFDATQGLGTIAVTIAAFSSALGSLTQFAIDFLIGGARTKGSARFWAYMTIATRRSGDPHTSVANAILNFLATAYSMARTQFANNSDYYVLVNGDDNVTYILPNSAFTAHDFSVELARNNKRLGFNSEVALVEDPCFPNGVRTGFCSAIFVPMIIDGVATHMLCADIRRVMCKMGFSLDDRSPTKAAALLRNTILGLSYFRALPLASAFWDAFLCSPEQALAGSADSYTPWKHAPLADYQPSEATWTAYCSVLGIGRQAVGELSAWLIGALREQTPCLKVIRHPLLDQISLHWMEPSDECVLLTHRFSDYVFGDGGRPANENHGAIAKYVFDVPYASAAASAFDSVQTPCADSAAMNPNHQTSQCLHVRHTLASSVAPDRLKDPKSTPDLVLKNQVECTRVHEANPAASQPSEPSSMAPRLSLDSCRVRSKGSAQ